MNGIEMINGIKNIQSVPLLLEAGRNVNNQRERTYMHCGGAYTRLVLTRNANDCANSNF